VSFPVPPNTILANTNYQLRIKGSNPLTYSPPNQYPFKIAKVGTLPDIAFFPEGYWRGSFFTWKPNIQTIITNANTQAMFDPGNYLGYVTKEALSFDLDWGFDVEAAPGTKFDTNKVCGVHSNFYSIRMRRKINFEAGYYIFGGGGDDGFRLSTDGGTTWLIDFWRDQEYTGKLNNNGCGVFLEAGPKNILVDYYERGEKSRFQVIIKRTGDPLANPLQIINPVIGDSVCLQSAPFQLLSNAQGAETWSGPGVSPNGIFNPSVAGLGLKTITYETGMAGFGSNCVKSTTINIQVVPGVKAEFSGLDSAYCQSGDTVTLIPKNSNGVFYGAGVLGNKFIPSKVPVGNTEVTFFVPPSLGCQADTLKKAVKILDVVSADFNPLPDSICGGSPRVQLTPTFSGGTFSGEGVLTSKNQWIPEILESGKSYKIEYSIILNSCSNKSEQTVFLRNKAKPTLVLDGVKSFYCNTESPFKPVSAPISKFYLAGNEVNEINPSAFKPGSYSLNAIYLGDNTETCLDSASSKLQFEIVEVPKPDLGIDQEVEWGSLINLSPKTVGNFSWSSDNSALSFENNKDISFNPTEDVFIKVSAADPQGRCVSTDSVFIKVRPLIEFTSLFTPNGDSFNDYWIMKGAVPDMKVTIFDRWGKEIFSGKNDGDIVWKGPSGKSAGTYFYIVEHPSDGRKWNGWVMVHK
jgi:gliding motility-associated-like protein